MAVEALKAQLFPVSFGFKAGMNLANFGGDTRSDAKLKYQFGTVVQANLPAGFYVVSGVEYTAKGAKARAENGTMTSFSPHYLQVPVRLGYEVGVLPEVNLQFSAGPYFAYGIAGKAKIEGEKISMFGEDGLNYDRQDFGVGVGVGVEFLRIATVTLGCDFGLKDISRREGAYTIGKVRNQNAYLTVGVKF